MNNTLIGITVDIILLSVVGILSFFIYYLFIQYNKLVDRCITQAKSNYSFDMPFDTGKPKLVETQPDFSGVKLVPETQPIEDSPIWDNPEKMREHIKDMTNKSKENRKKSLK